MAARTTSPSTETLGTEDKRDVTRLEAGAREVVAPEQVVVEVHSLEHLAATHEMGVRGEHAPEPLRMNSTVHARVDPRLALAYLVDPAPADHSPTAWVCSSRREDAARSSKSEVEARSSSRARA
jgi:hypothetical protein